MSFGLFVQSRSTQPARQVYRDLIEDAVLVEELGFDSIWLAARHFAASHAGLPTAFPLLAAIAPATQRLRLGAGIVPLLFEDPIRVAEDAAVVDHLSGGRLELGVGKGLGKGLSSRSHQVFGTSDEARDELYAEALARLREILDTGIRTDAGVVPIHPPPGTLGSRLWQSTGQQRWSALAGESGDGLIPHRSGIGRAEGTLATQIAAYKAGLPPGAAPRILFGGGLVPGQSREDALRIIQADIDADGAYYAGRDHGGDAVALVEKTALSIGAPDAIVTRLVSEEGFEEVNHVLFAVPLAPGSQGYRETLRLIAGEIIPRLRAHREASRAA